MANSIENYEKNTAKLEKEINVKSFCVKNKKKVIKGVKAAKFFTIWVPFMIGGLFATKGLSNDGRHLFIKDKIIEKQNELSINYSNGESLTKKSYDEKYESELLYSTKWEINQDNNYERTVYSFDVSNLLNYSPDELYSLTREEIMELFPIINVERIVKNEVIGDDHKFEDTDLIIVNQASVSDEVYREVDEDFDGFLTEILYYIIVMCFGAALSSRILFVDKIDEKLDAYIERVEKLDENSIEELKRVVEFRKENIKLLG